MRSNKTLGPLDFAGLTFIGHKQTNKHPNKLSINRFSPLKDALLLIEIPGMEDGTV